MVYVLGGRILLEMMIAIRVLYGIKSMQLQIICNQQRFPQLFKLIWMIIFIMLILKREQILCGQMQMELNILESMWAGLVRKVGVLEFVVKLCWKAILRH